MPDNHTTALVKTATSPALARVSSQLALTDKLLAKPEEPFLIPYRREKSWYFCDKAGNIVIDRVYEYPKFLDEYKPVDWYVYYGKDGEVVWKQEQLIHSRSNLPQNATSLWTSYVVINTNKDKNTITFKSTSDVIFGKGKLDGRETVIIGRRPCVDIWETQTWWMRKPSYVTIDIYDIFRVKNDIVEDDLLINLIVPRD